VQPIALVAGVAAGAVLVFSAAAGTASAKTRRRGPQVVQVLTPTGLQGRAGSGVNVAIAFTLADRAGRRSDVQVQFGIDLNGDALIEEDEYRPATEDSTDLRDSRSRERPYRFASASGAGATQFYVWKSYADLANDALLTLDYALSPQGRPIPDPDNPGSYLFAPRPGGTPFLAGVKVRARSIRGRGRHARGGEWVYTNSFDVDNRGPVSATIDSVASSAADPTLVLAGWTAYQADSEDLNGNGLLDIADGEDRNGNGLLDCVKAGVAFDFHRVAAGEDPSTATDADLASWKWYPCTRRAGVGDTDGLDVRPGWPIPETGDLAGVCTAPVPVGRHWTFAWDARRDAGGANLPLILRATPFDQHGAHGATVYSRTIVSGGP
jgi:hypothetical protein